MDQIIRDKLKATLEAMLFVATQPIPLKKMTRKCRHVAKKEIEKMKERQLHLELPGDYIEEDILDETDKEPLLEEKVVVVSEAVAEVELEDEEEKEQETEQEQIVEIEAKTETETDEETDEEGNTDDIMAQLLKKQEELELEITNSDIKKLLLEIQETLSQTDHGVELVAVAKGYQLRTKYEVSEYLRDEKLQAPSRFSPSALEALAVIAYQQPVTRQKVEEIRGVDSGGVMKTLLEKGIIRLVGRSEEPGRPLVYGTSKKFLEIFGLNHLKDLPNLFDYKSMELSNPEAGEPGEVIDAEQNINISDLLEDEVTHFSEEEDEILSDLNESMKNLRKVEKDIMQHHQEKPQEEQVAEGAPEVPETAPEPETVVQNS